MNLYFASKEYSQILERAEQLAIDSDGEISDTLASELERAEMNFEDMILDSIKTIKNLKAEADALAEESKRLADRKHRSIDKMETIKKWLLECGVTSFKSTEGVITTRTSKSVEIDMFTAVPEEYTRIKREADKIAIKKAIENGAEFDFARIVEKVSLGVK